MATNNRITYTLDFKANFKDVQGQLNSLRQSLNSVASAGFGAHIAPNIQKASQAAIALQGHLKKALDPSTGRLDLSRLQTQLSASGQSAKTLGTNLLQGGREGAQAFLQLSNAIVNAQKPMHRFSELSRSLWTTLKNTVKWQISSSALNAVTSALSNSVRFATDLDTSLNKIRIVSGASRQEMEKFAVEANKAAKSLSSSTTAFTDATLIYRQQGDTAAEAQKKAEITIKAANAAGVKAQEMSEYLTGIWNSYQVGTKDLELFIDKLVRVGAVTATSAEELSTSMTKVAATANTVGVSYDQLLSTIATVSSATRTSAETIGTAFKTIYARMGDLELKGSIDEDGVTTTLGTVSSQLKQVGVDVLDANGEIRDMGLVVEDLGNKWQTMSLNQKTAIAEAVAGKRQYTQLFALFDNWPEYTRTLNETATAQGELNKQQATYADSVKGAQQRFKAAKEDFLLDAGFGGESIKLFLDGASTIMDALDEITEAAGGIEPILLALGSYMMQKFAPQISQGLVDIGAGIASTFGMGQKSVEKVRSQMQQLFAEARNNKYLQDPVSKASIDSMQALLEAQTNLENKAKNLNSQERERLKIILDIIKAKHQEELATASTHYRNAQDAISTSERYLKSNSPVVGEVTGDVNTLAIASRGGNEVEAMMGQVQEATGRTTMSIKEFAGALAQLEITINDNNMQLLARAMGETGTRAGTLVSNLRILGDNVLNITNLENDLREAVRQCTSALENEDLIAGDTSDEEADINAKKNQIKTYKELIQTIKELQGNHADNYQHKGKTRTRPKDDYFAAAELLNKENVTTEEIDKNIATLNSHKHKIETNVDNADNNNLDEQKAVKNYNKEKQAIEDLIQALETLRQEKQKDNDTPVKTSFKETAENVTKNIGAVAQGMTSLAMAGSSFNSMVEENASGMQQLMSAGMLLNSVMGVASAINKTAIKDYAALAVANIFYRKEIKATGKALKAKAAAEFLSKTASKGVVGATVAAATALAIGLVALYKYNKANSEGAKQAKKFAAAEKEIEKNTEELSDKESKLDTFTSLKEKLEDATTSASKLAEIEKELNKELGINIDLVNGGAEARARANAILNSSINATEDEVEEIKKRNAEERKRAIANLGMESTNDKMSRRDSLYVLREFNKKSEDYQENFWSGEYGNEDFETGGSYGLEGFSPDKMKDFIDKNNEYIKNEIQNDILPYYSSSIAGQLQTVSTELLESGYDPQSFLDAYRENYNEIETAFTSGDSETLSKLLDELYSFDSKESTEKSEQAFKNFKQKILALEKDTNKEIKNELENSSTVLSNSFTGLRDLADANSNLLDSFAKNKTLDTETISKYVKQIKEDLQLSADETTQIQEALLNADSKEDIGNIIGEITLNQILKNKTLLDQIGTSEGFNQIVKIFSENNIANAKELATQIQKNANVAKELNEQFSNLGAVSNLRGSKPVLITDEWKNKLEQLQNEYGYTEEAAHALLMQETIFNNSSLDVNQRIAALKQYIQVMGLADTELGKLVNDPTINPENFNVRNLTKEQKSLFNITDDQKGIEAYEQMLSSYISLQNQYDYQIELNNKSTKELEDARKEYEEEKDEWFKENDIAKIEDYIERLTRALDKLDDKISHLDFAKSLYGEDEVPLEYINESISTNREKANQALSNFNAIKQGKSQYSEGTKEYLAALKTNQEAYRSAMLAINTLEDTLETEKETLADLEEQGLEYAEEEATILEDAAKEALEGVSSLISIIFETIDKVYEASKKLMELWNNDNAASRKSGVASLISASISGSISIGNQQQERKEEKKAIAKRKKDLADKVKDWNKEKEKHTRIKKEEYEEIIKLDREMVDTISDYADESMEQGIIERQADRDKELKKIEEDYSNTVTNISSNVNTALDTTQQKLNTMLSTIQTILAEQAKITGQSGFKATAYDNKVHMKSDSNGDFSLQNVTQSAAGYRITGLDKKKGKWTIQSYDDYGNMIDEFYYDITDGTGGTLNKDLVEKFESYGGQPLNIDAGQVLGNAKDVYFVKTKTQTDKGIVYNKPLNQNQAEVHGATFKASTSSALTSDGKEIYKDGVAIGKFIYSTNGGYATIPDAKNQKFKNKGEWETWLRYIGGTGTEIIKWYPGHAKGSKSTPAGEAFVGEEGRELILLPDGSIILAGQDGIELANLPEGARVLTNEETEKIFKNKKDYANLASSLKSDSGKKVNYNSYAEGTKGTSNNSGSTEDFHKTELKEQEEQNQKIIESLQKRNTQIEQDEKNYHDESLKKTEEYHTESLDSADKYYVKDRQDLGIHQSKVLTQTAQHRGTIQTNTNLANQALINGAQATRTILEETINQMKFTLPAIDSLEFVKSMDKAIQDIFTEVNAERDESGVKVGPSSGGGTGKGGSAEEAEEEKLPQGNDTTAKVWSYYKKLGFSDAGVAGIIGNMVRENGVPDPDTYEADFLSAAKKYNKDDIMKNPKLATDYFWNVVFPNTPSVKNGNGYRGTDGNYYPGFGVGSFTGPMAQDFLKYAASKGKRWDDLNTQLDYITNRLQSSGKYDLIKNATDYEQAAKDTYLGHYYPGDKSLKFFGSSAVYSGAKKALEKYSNGQYKNYVQQEKFKGTFVDLLTQITKDGIESVISGMINTSENYGLNTEGWMDPVPTGTPITSQFGMRIHPITGKQRQHSGIDLGATGGTAIVATKDGTVIVSAAPSQSGGYGNYIVIDHGGGYSTAYAHMAQLPNFKVGDKVKQGDVIGTVGSTGNSTGDHLHYEVRYNGKAINPKNFLSYAIGGTTKGGKALVGEYGKEIILYPDGTAGLLGVNGMEYADLPAGAQIIPADETERILKNKRNYQDKAHPISSFAKGTKDLTKEEITQTQKFLSDSGYYIGTYSNGSPLIDGIFGKLTSDALDLYFQNNKDGFASIEDLLSRILEIEEKQESNIENLASNAEASSEQQAPKEELLPITDMMTKVANSMAKEKVPDADKKGIQDIIRDLGGVNWQNAVTAAETYLSAFTSDEIQKIQDTLTSQNPEYYMGEGGVVNEYLLHNFLREQDRISAENMRDVLKPVFSEQFLLAKEYVLNHGAFKTDEDYEDNYKLRLTEYINQKNTTKDIEKLIKMYQNVNAPDFTQKSTEIAAKANEEAYRFAEAELNNILTEYMAYLTLVEQGSMERDQNYENYISEVMSIISENMEDAAEAAESIKQHFEDMQDKEWTFDTERGTAFGEWNAENDLAIARDKLMTALREDPKDYETIFNQFTEYTEAYQTMFTDMISQMKTMNDERVEKVQILVDRATKLVSLTQEYYNEINGLNDTLHTINKELTTAKTKTQWFDEKTKEMIFNEKDYLAISQKVQENLTTAEKDRLATQQRINSLGKDEQYKIDHILEAYKERVTIRNKELEILKEELNLTKKQATLNDAIMNRNVRVFSGGRWRQIANIETVTKAQEDFDETKYQISKKQTELTQQLDIDSQNAAIRSNEDKISAWNKEVELVNEAFTKWQNSLIKQYDESTLNLAFFTGAFDAAARTILSIRDRYYNTYMVDDIEDLNPSQQQYHRLIAQAKQAYEATGDSKYHQLAEVYRQEAATKYNDPGWLTEGSKMDFNTYVQARGLFGENFSSPDTKSLLMTILSAKESWQALENSNLPDEVKTALQDKAHEDAESARKVLEVLDPESYSLFSEETLSQSEGNPLEVFKEKIKEKYGEEVVQSIEDISNSTTAMINSVTEMVTSGAINLNAIQEVFEKATLDNLTTIVEKLKTLYQRVIASTQADATTVTVQSNAQGTADSKPGLSWVNEKGVEMLSTKYGQLIELNPHQKIFNNEQLNYLYEMSKQKLRGINSTVAAMTATDNSMRIDNLNISLDKVTDAESFVNELQGLTHYIKNIKTIKGSSY